MLASRPLSAAQVWMGPPMNDQAHSFRELFEHPDQWTETRKAVDVLFATDLRLREFKDDELRAWFGQMHDWNLKLAMEVGALKEWGQTGEKCFNAERKNWERLQGLGANLYAISMDEPLCACREHINKTDDYALEETAQYIKLVREAFPTLLIGDIETYPSITIEDHEKWIEGLQKRLAELKVRGLDFYRLDVDWVRFTVQNKGSWKEARQLELYCRQHKLPFSMIYWPSGFESLRKQGLGDDSTYYTSTMQQGYDYHRVGGNPDQYVIESWVQAPAHAVPETDEWTFTRTVRDFARKFAPRTEK
jgi:hypothetical protein